MKILVFLLACVAIAVAKSVPYEVTKVTRGELTERTYDIKNEALKAKLTTIFQKHAASRLDLDIGELVDELLVECRKIIQDLNLDPVDIPDMNLGFSYKPLLITYHGELDLTEGNIADISTMYRSGDASLSLGNTLGISIPIGFTDLLLNYHYSAKIMNIGPTGSVKAKLKDAVAYIDVNLDLSTLQITDIEFKITAGKLDVSFGGNFLTDWLVNILTDLVTTIFRNTIFSITNSVINGVLTDYIDLINEVIAGLLS